MAALLTTTPVVAPPPGRKIAQPDSVFVFGFGNAAAGPSTTGNDDGCDISVAPAATLFLPYFEVDCTSPRSKARTTLFTVVNTSNLPAIAKVTLWTDWAYPVLDFNIFLTGYDVQAINLYDVLQYGVISRTSGIISTGAGAISSGSGDNPNFAGSAFTECLNLPSMIPPGLVADVRASLTTGANTSCGALRVGSTHANAVGYAAIDLVNSCTSTLPTTGSYYTSELLFDNWLIGDYQELVPDPATGDFASGRPLVHIRAVPEGGPAGSVPVGVTSLPFTFYARYVQNTGTGTLTRSSAIAASPCRRPFAARYIQGGPLGFDSRYRIWREGKELVAAPAGYGRTATTATGSCASVKINARIPVFEIVRYDEHENPTTFAAGVIINSVTRAQQAGRAGDRNGLAAESITSDISPSVPAEVDLPAASDLPTSSGSFPPISTSGDVGGWTYLNIGNRDVAGSSTLGPGPAPGRVNVLRPNFGAAVSQNWVVVSMSTAKGYAVDFDAASLGNGCTPAIETSTANGGAVFMGPAGMTPVCPASSVAIGCSPGVAPYIGTNTTP